MATSVNFVKMQSLGNDFIIIDASQFSQIPSGDFFKKISDRHFGVGCDLVVLYKIMNITNDTTTVKACFFNADGSQTEICGNATKCIGWLMYELNHTNQCIMQTSSQEFQIFTKNKEEITITWDKKVEVFPFDISNISNDLYCEHEVFSKILITEIFQVSVGNPHLVLFLNDIPSIGIIKNIGAKIENNSVFPHKTNVDFAKKISEDTIELRVFERGAGLTLACGSGALATAIAAKKRGIIKESQVIIKQKGGDLKINFLDNEKFLQTGPAEKVFSGNIAIEVPHIDLIGTKKKSNKITIYTDGACSGNPGPGGWGAVIIEGEKISEISGGEQHTTNNQMELTAVIKALTIVDVNEEIEIYTDSQYVKNGINQWIQNWVKNGWKNSANQPVKNQELWKKLLEITNNRQISWKWVKGHNGNKFNERADTLAQEQSHKYA